MVRAVQIAGRVIFALMLPAAVLGVVIAAAVNCAALYHYGFVKYDTGATTGLEMAQMDRAAAALIDYWNSDEDLISVTVTRDGQSFELFNEQEKLHLRDVKNLIRLDYRVLAVSGGLILALVIVHVLRRRWREIALSFFWGSGLTLALALAFGIASLIDFNALFIRFHLLSFSNDLWLLDPTKDYLIMLFPQGFWQDAFLFCAAAIIIIPMLLGAGGLLYLRRSTRAA